MRSIATVEDPSLMRSFRGHEKSITSLCFSHDQKQIASCGLDAMVYLWNFNPKLRPFKLLGHKGSVWKVIYSADDKKIYSAGEDKDIRIWNNSVTAKSTSIKAHTSHIFDLKLTADSSLLVSCSADKSIKLWNQSCKFKKSLNGHTNWVRQCDIARDNRLLLTCSDDKTVKIWDIPNASLVQTYSQSSSELHCCQFSPDGTCFAAGSTQGTIKIWDSRSGGLIQHYNAHPNNVNSIAFHPQGSYMNSAGEDGLIKIWDLRKGRQAWSLTGSERAIKAIAFNQKGNFFASGGGDSLVMIWKSNFDQFGTQNQNRQNIKQFITKDDQTIKPLWKSNRAGQPPLKQQQQKPNESQNAEEPQHPLSEAMAPVLQKLVNQMQIIITKITGMDTQLAINQQAIAQLRNDPRIVKLLDKYEDDPKAHLAVWEAHRQKRIQKLQEIGDQEDLNRSFIESGRAFTAKDVSEVAGDRSQQVRLQADQQLRQTLRMFS